MAIGHSPFYDTGKTTLPNGALVEPGGLYVIDDAGGVVFQVFTDPEADLLTGTIDLNTGVAIVNNISGTLSAQSYKVCTSTDAQPTTLTNGMTILHLIESGRPPLDTSDCKFKVRVGLDDHYFLYDVCDDNAQLAMVHEIEERHPPMTETEAAGLLYVQYQQKVYIGFPTATDIDIYDPDECFY